MTTIAYDGKTLAADSKVSSRECAFGTMEKIKLLSDGRLLAIAGSLSLIPEIVSWLGGGDKPKLEDNESVCGLVVNTDGSAFEISDKLRIWPACLPWAGGSGETIALTAMRCGKSAAEAVEIACEIDNSSGGPVQAVEVSK